MADRQLIEHDAAVTRFDELLTGLLSGDLQRAVEKTVAATLEWTDALAELRALDAKINTTAHQLPRRHAGH